MSIPRQLVRPTVDPGPRSDKGETTRTAIVEAAFRFLWSHPFRDMTVNTLMSKTKVVRSAFYHYFRDLHELMEKLLITLENEILVGAQPWLFGSGDPVALLDASLAELVKTCYRRGPFLKAISDAAPTDHRLELAWLAFLGRFDDAISARIAADQQIGIIDSFDPRPLAVALNRLDAYTFIQAFGQRPRGQPEPVRAAITRLWISSLYGERWIEDRRSDLVRPQGDVPQLPSNPGHSDSTN